MAEFMYITIQQCKDISKRSTEVNGYTVTRFKGWEFVDCSCKGFQFRRKCKHLQIAQETVCDWHQVTGIAQTENQKKNMICPVCNGQTEYAQFAV